MADHSVDTRIQNTMNSFVGFLFSFIPPTWIPVLLAGYAAFLDLFEKSKTQFFRTTQFITDSFASETLYFPHSSVSTYPVIYREGTESIFGTPNPIWTYDKSTAVLKNTTVDLPCKNSLPFLDATLYEEDHNGVLRVIGSWDSWPERVRTNRRTEIPWTVLLFSWAFAENISLPLHDRIYRLHVIQEDASDLWIRLDHGKDTVLADLEQEETLSESQESNHSENLSTECPVAPRNSVVSEEDLPSESPPQTSKDE